MSLFSKIFKKRKKNAVIPLIQHFSEIVENKSTAVFSVLEPKIELTVSVSECVKELNRVGLQYDQVSASYITFPAKLFNGLDMIVGLHFRGAFVDYIEIFRPLEYRNSPNFDIKKSYAEIHDAVVSCYGNPQAQKPCYLSEYPSERWLGRNFVMDHSICDRFGLEEHLSFKFVKP